MVLSDQGLSDQNRPDDGFLSRSVEDISRRLGLWAKRDTTGIIRIEYSSEFARQRVIQYLKTELSSQEISLVEIVLPAFQDAETVVKTLITQLEALVTQPKTVVSVTGFATAFGLQMPLGDALRVLNFNRDRYVSLPLKQLWWMTPSFMQSAIHAMPDLNSFFLQRLQLTEIVLPETQPPQLIDSDSPTANIDDARQRAYGLLRQFETAKTSDASPQDLLNTYVLPALEALADVGAQKELRDLTQQFEGILSQIKVTDSPELATSLGRLANLYAAQGRYSEAKPLYKKALSLRQQLLGNDHPDVAISYGNLAGIYEATGQYEKAEPLRKQALQIHREQLGEDHPYVATGLHNLAYLYQSQGRYGEAEPLYQKALTLHQRLLGDDHPGVTTSLNNLALLYQAQGRYREAESLYRDALTLYQRLLGDDHPDVATSLNNLADLYESQGRYGEAEPLYVQALTIAVQRLGEDHPNTQIFRRNFVGLLQAVVAAGQAHLLSNHPTTQALLAQLQP